MKIQSVRLGQLLNQSGYMKSIKECRKVLSPVKRQVMCYIKKTLETFHLAEKKLGITMKDNKIRERKYTRICHRKYKTNGEAGRVTPYYINRKELFAVYEEMHEIIRKQLYTYPVYMIYKSLKTQFRSLIPSSTLEKKDDQSMWRKGLLALSLDQSYHFTKNIRDFHCLTKFFDEWAQRGYPVNSPGYALNGYVLIDIQQITNDIRYRAGVEKLKKYIMAHVRDSCGSLPYNINQPYEIYIDSIGMVCPFLCRYGKVYQDREATELAITQIQNYLRYGFDDASSLPYHGYNAMTGIKYGIIGWGRGLGWLLFGLAESLSWIEPSCIQYEYLIKSFRRIVDTVVKYQKPDGSYTWQLTAFEGPVDTSVAAMILYAVMRGVNLGFLDKNYLYYTNLGITSLIRQIQSGEIINASQESSGFGVYPQNYGPNYWAQGAAAAFFAMHLYK